MREKIRREFLVGMGAGKYLSRVGVIQFLAFLK